jgi:hypothetical protein
VGATGALGLSKLPELRLGGGVKGRCTTINIKSLSQKPGARTLQKFASATKADYYDILYDEQNIDFWFLVPGYTNTYIISKCSLYH